MCRNKRPDRLHYTIVRRADLQHPWVQELGTGSKELEKKNLYWMLDKKERNTATTNKKEDKLQSQQAQKQLRMTYIYPLSQKVTKSWEASKPILR